MQTHILESESRDIVTMLGSFLLRGDKVVLGHEAGSWLIIVLIDGQVNQESRGETLYEAVFSAYQQETTDKPDERDKLIAQLQKEVTDLEKECRGLRKTKIELLKRI